MLVMSGTLGFDDKMGFDDKNVLAMLAIYVYTRALPRTPYSHYFPFFKGPGFQITGYV